ncbi:uncharacterized protein LOC121640054 [Melanotaenia boesemani]|uniref:uncharacterized protein LOC121640054 n=1 Tax=Melanotaenia boesemani TaxID=1250792 RepID=UPI001C044EA1|nr:uncharacterized protein LOC121640054 [Melanotaenia boesemani]
MFFQTNRRFIRVFVTSHDGGEYQCCGHQKSTNVKKCSNILTLKVSDKPRPFLTVSPSQRSPGSSVTLTCAVEHPTAGWKFYWYKVVPGLSIKNNNLEELPYSDDGTEKGSYIIHERTHTAGYVCRAGRVDRVYFTDYSELKFVCAADSSPGSSSSRVHFISWQLCGMLLLTVLLLLLRFLRKKTDISSNSSSQCVNISQISTTQQTANQNGTPVYSSLLHGDASVYESVRDSGNNGNDEPAIEYYNLVCPPSQDGSIGRREPTTIIQTA